MTDRDRLLGELKAAADVRQRYRKSLTEAQGRVAEVRAKLRATREFKAIKAAKNAVLMREREWKRACDSHDAVETELLTGMTGLQLFDQAVADGQAAIVEAAPA